MSGNGLALVFTSSAQNLVPGPDANRGQTDVFHWRLDDSTITRVSVDAQRRAAVAGRESLAEREP